MPSPSPLPPFTKSFQMRPRIAPAMDNSSAEIRTPAAPTTTSAETKRSSPDAEEEATGKSEHNTIMSPKNPQMQAATLAPLTPPAATMSFPAGIGSILECAVQLPPMPAPTVAAEAESLSPGPTDLGSLSTAAAAAEDEDEDEDTARLVAAVVNTALFFDMEEDEAADRAIAAAAESAQGGTAQGIATAAGSPGREIDSARDWVGRKVDITSIKYNLHMVLPDTHAFTDRGDSIVECRDWDTIRDMMCSSHNLSVEFEWRIESVPSSPGHVALRARRTNLYLTAQPYGERVRNMYASFFAKECEKNILRIFPHDIVHRIVDYIVDDACPDEWLEGPGFHYSPVTARRGPPDTSQMFVLTDRDHRGIPFVGGNKEERGMRTYFGAYIRAMGGRIYASQSPLCEDDERWEILSGGDDDDDDDYESDNAMDE